MNFIIVCATRESEPRFYQNSALGRTLQHSYPNFPIQRKIFFNNARPLAACYNEAIEDSGADDILVFIHDDVFLVDFFWMDKLHWGFQHFDVLGVAGNKRRVPKQPGWAFINEQFKWDDISNLSGVVGHGNGFPCKVTGFGPPGQMCKLLDGVLLSAKKSALDKSKIRFDPFFDFHFYDMDFCRQCELAELRMGTVPLCIIHESGGDFTSMSWKDNLAKYLKKWGD